MNKRTKIAVMLAVIVFGACFAGAAERSARSSRRGFRGERWKLGMQAYSFNRFTFEEAVAKTKALGMGYIEAYPGQRLSKDKPNVKTDHNMSDADMLAMKQILRQANVKLMNYGVVGLPNNEAECKKVFEFAKKMGIETIVSEPPEDAFDIIEAMCNKYEINVAIHNHPKPSHYWNPDTVLKVCEGRSERIGACADTGHWMRSGVNPLEAVKKLKGRIVSLHLKDLNEFGVRNAHDVIWGTGKADMPAILAELKDQGFGRESGGGVFSVEYEHNWLNSMPEIAGCASFFERTKSELGLSRWQWIFNGKDLEGWDGDPRLWSVKDGVIHGETTKENPARGNTFLFWRDGTLKDFELKLKFKIQNGNSGVQYRSKEIRKWVASGYQAEVENAPGKVGFLYHEAGRGWLVNVGDIMEIDKDGNKKVIGNVSDKDELIKAGYYNDKDWNEYHIIAQGNQLKHFLNGYPTMTLIDNDRITDPEDKKDTKGAAREGLLALQIHAGPPMVVEFKDIRIRQSRRRSYLGDAELLFNGKNLDGWNIKGDKSKSKWVVGKAAVSPDDPKKLIRAGDGGELINLAAKHGDSLDIFSTKEFGDCMIELEVMVPQGSNSGIYVMGEYEIQVLDSWNRDDKLGMGDMGAIYGASEPKVNATRRPGEWQKYRIFFRAPRFDAAGKKTENGNATFSLVELNGVRIHDMGQTVDKVTGGAKRGTEFPPKGPLMFQGNHGPVAYRNIVVRRLRSRD